MDLNKIKEKLNSLQSKGKKEKVDYSTIFWRPKKGKHQIRVVPSKFDSSTPFREVFMHYGLTKFPILALSNFEEADPVLEFTKKLRQGQDKEGWSLAKKLDPRMRVMVPIIVRGEEEKGVRLWEFGKELYMSFLAFAEDEDYADYDDVNSGRDFTVDAVEDSLYGRTIVKCSIRPKPKTSALTSDKDQLKKWLEEQPDILSINKKHTYEELKSILQNWLQTDESSASESQEDTKVPNDLPWEEDDSKTKKSKAIDELFAS
jgi:hypothetical protein